LAADSGVERHAGLIEDRPTGHVDILDAGCREPLRPVVGVVDVQERVSREVCGLVKRVVANEKLGAADKHEFFGAQPGNVQPIGLTVSMVDGKIKVFACKIDMMKRRVDPQVDSRIGRGESREAMHQPFRRKIRRGTDGSPLSGTGLIVGILGLVATSQRSWWGKFSARLALAIFFLVTVATVLGSARLDWIQGFQRYRIVIELLIGIALLQRVVLRLGLHGLIKRSIAGVHPRWRSSVVGILSMILTIPLSLATVPLVTTVMASVVTPPIAAARISMRAVTITMLLVPTTLASAAVSASLPGLSGAMVALAGLPLFLVGFATICLQRIELSGAVAEEPKWQRLVVFGAVFWLLFGIALALGCPIPEAIAVAGVCLYLGEALFASRSPQASLAEFREAVSGSSAEVLLLLACGILATLLASIGESPLLSQIVATLWGGPLVAAAWVTVFLPAICVLGIHPIILFSLVFPLVDSGVFGGLHLQYLAWVTMFTAGQLVSPASISAILAASSLHTAPSNTSYRLHGRYVLGMCLITYCYLIGVRYLF
jgi:hypothetical protein